MSSWLIAERTKTTKCNATRHRCLQLNFNWGAAVLFFISIGISPFCLVLTEIAAEERCSGVFAPLSLLLISFKNYHLSPFFYFFPLNKYEKFNSLLNWHTKKFHFYLIFRFRISKDQVLCKIPLVSIPFIDIR